MIELAFEPDHAAARGHFPGNPVIPGAVLLSETLRAIAAVLHISPARVLIRSAKFPSPARPGDRVRVSYTQTDRGEIRFACAVGERPVLTGLLSCHDTPAAG